MSTSVPNTLTEEQLGPIARVLLAVAGKKPTLLSDEAQYRRAVIDPAWDRMPASVRSLGREQLNWDQHLLDLRDDVFEVRGGSVRLRDDYRGRLAGRLGSMHTHQGRSGGATEAGAASASAWYLRSRGRVTGPFSNAAIATMVQRGQLARFHEVSSDRAEWRPAGEVLSVFQKSASPVRSTASASAPVAESGSGYSVLDEPAPERRRRENQAVGWYIGRGSNSIGPIPFADLEQLIADGEVGPETLIWNESMPDWVAAADVPEIASRVGSAPPSLPRGQAARLAPAPAAAAMAPAYAGGSHPNPYAMPRTSGMAIASLVLGLLWLGGLGSLLAVIFGSIAVGQINKSNGMIQGKGMAWSGLILGIIGMALVFLAVLSTGR